MKKILVVLCVLIAILFVLSSLMMKKQIKNAKLIITSPQGKEYPVSDFTQADMKTLETSKGTFKAISVMSIIEGEKIKSNFDKLTFYSSDGAEVTVMSEELANLYLAEITKKDKTYLRLVIPSDAFAQRWLKYINQIKLQ